MKGMVDLLLKHNAMVTVDKMMVYAHVHIERVASRNPTCIPKMADQKTNVQSMQREREKERS